MDKAIAKRFGKGLRRARLSGELTQDELAHEAGLDRTYISLLERGLRQPSLTTIFLLADALEVQAEELVANAQK